MADSLIVSKGSLIEPENNDAFSKSEIETHMQRQEEKVDMSEAVDAGLVVTESSWTKPDKQNTSSSSGSYKKHSLWMQIHGTREEEVDQDALLKLCHSQNEDLVDKEILQSKTFKNDFYNWKEKNIVNSRAKVQSPKIRNNNPVEPKNHTHKPGRQMVLDKWIPYWKVFIDSTTKVDSEPPNGSNDDITNPYECNQTLYVSACTSNSSAEKVIHESSSTSDSERTESETEAAAPKGDKDQDEVDTSTVSSGVSISVSDPEKSHEALAGPDPEPMKEDHTGSDSGKLHMSLAGPNPEHMDDEFLATAYPKVHENLKLITDERVIDDKPESHSGSMSSMKNLDDTFNFGDQFLYDKPTEDDQEKSKVREESDSTIPDPSYQTVTSTPPVIAPFINVSSSKPSLLVTPLPINTEATTITTSLPEITPFIALQLRVARLEQEMSEVKKTDHSADVLASIRSQVPTAVDKYLGTKLDDALLKVLERHTADLIEKYSVMPGPESVKNQESEKSPKEIIRAKKEQGEEKQDSTYSIRSTDKVDLEEFDLKSALFKHMNKIKSANRNTANYHLYHALMEALIADEDAMDKEVADKVKDHKRKHDSDDDEDDDDDEGPSAGSNQGKSAKRRRHDSGASGSAQPPTKDDEQSSKKPRESDASASKQHPALTSTGWQITDTRDAGADSSMHRSDPESEHSETYSIRSTDTVDLEEFDLKSALFKHMNKIKSANRNTTNYHLYHALMEALIADEDAMDKEVADKVKDHKRKHDSDDDEDDDDDEGPSAGSNQGKSAKRRRHDSGASGSAQPPTKDDEQSSKKPRESDASASKQHPALTSTGWQITDTRDAVVDSSMHRSDPESEHSEQSSDDIPMQDDGHVSDMEDTDNAHIPKVSTTTWFKPIPEGERPATPEPEWTIPPNDFPEPENNWANTYATTYKVPEENKLQRKTYDIGSFIKWFCRRTGKKKLCKADLEGPAFNLRDYQEYKISEKDFKNLHPNDFEDLFLLNIQEKLNHLPKTDKTSLHTAVNMWIRNLDAADYYFKEDYTIVPKPRAVVYRDRNDQRKLMRLNELHKFSDGTLTRVMEKLDHMVKDFHLFEYNKGMETRKWSEDDKRRSKDFITAIEKRLQIRRIYRSLESFVGGRIRDIDYRLINRTT
ncbi:hypothetical protein Tco_0842609 [Tanacetum coccineum]|uniref:Uncharacterized protein n=1 Tax=Tanacetum coccineum TaxID=301880 RepID=A0ABQ5B1Y3_9ASTR